MRYLILQSHETKGPYTLEQLRSMWHSGLVTGETLFCEDGTENWSTLETIAAKLEPTSAPPPMPGDIAPPVPLSAPLLPAPLPARNQSSAMLIFKSVFWTIVLVFVGLPLLVGIISFMLGSAPSIRSASASKPQSAAFLMSQVELSLGQGQFAQAAGFLNRIVSEHPTSRQRIAVDKFCSILREKENNKAGPVTADEARRLRKMIDSFETIKRGYRTATPEKREALESIFGAETFSPE